MTIKPIQDMATRACGAAAADCPAEPDGDAVPASVPWRHPRFRCAPRSLGRGVCAPITAPTAHPSPESTRLQYGLVDRALALGWAKARVLVIDEDLGKVLR